MKYISPPHRAVSPTLSRLGRGSRWSCVDPGPIAIFSSLLHTGRHRPRQLRDVCRIRTNSASQDGANQSVSSTIKRGEWAPRLNSAPPEVGEEVFKQNQY